MKTFMFTLLFAFLLQMPGKGYSQQIDTLRLDELRKLAVKEQSTKRGLQYATQLAHEAKKQGDSEQFVFGSYYKLIYYYNNQDFDKVESLADTIIPLAEKRKIWLVYFDVQKIRIYCNNVTGDYELGIHNARLMLDKAREVNYEPGIIQANICLGMTYVATERYQEGIDVLLEAYELIKDKNNTINYLDAVTLLISCNHFMGNFDEVYYYVEKYKEGIDNYRQHNPLVNTVNSYYALTEIYYGYYYLHKDKPDQAFSHLLLAEQLLSVNGFIVYKMHLHAAMSQYYSLVQNYPTAIARLDSSIAIAKEIIPRGYYNHLAKKADILMKMGDMEHALPLYRTAIYGKDSLNREVSKRQLLQYRKIYNINQHQIEREKLKSDKQKIVLIFITVILLILLPVMTHSALVRKKLKEATKQMKEATKLATEANNSKDRFLSNLSYSIRTPLNSVVGFSQLISDEAADQEMRKEYGTIVRKSAKELMNLVNNVLDLSRLEAGMMKFDLERNPVGQILEHIEYLIKSQYQDIILLIQFDIEQDEIYTDNKRLIKTILSTLTLPPADESKQKEILVTKDTSCNMVVFTIKGASLANKDNNTKEAVIQNEINRLFIEHFGGTYQIDTDNHIITLTYPVIES